MILYERVYKLYWTDSVVFIYVMNTYNNNGIKQKRYLNK